jgi:hypothetical protein
MIITLSLALAGTGVAAFEVDNTRRGLSTGGPVIAQCTGVPVVEMYTVPDGAMLLAIPDWLHITVEPSSTVHVADQIVAAFKALGHAESYRADVRPDHVLLTNWPTSAGPGNPALGSCSGMVGGRVDIRTFLDDPSCAAYRFHGNEQTDFLWPGPPGRVTLQEYLSANAQALGFSSTVRCETERCAVFMQTHPEYAGRGFSALRSATYRYPGVYDIGCPLQ